jgi:GGDEF domain-containing protein
MPSVSPGFFITGSVGISIYPRDAEDIEELQRRADIAMYAAKQRGKNTFSIYSPDQSDSLDVMDGIG